MGLLKIFSDTLKSPETGKYSRKSLTMFGFLVVGLAGIII